MTMSNCLYSVLLPALILDFAFWSTVASYYYRCVQEFALLPFHLVGAVWAGTLGSGNLCWPVSGDISCLHLRQQHLCDSVPCRAAQRPSLTWAPLHFSAGSTSSSLCEHWVSRLPGSKPASATSAASSRRTSLASLSESVEMTGERSEDDGECGFWWQTSKMATHRHSTGSLVFRNQIPRRLWGRAAYC